MKLKYSFFYSLLLLICFSLVPSINTLAESSVEVVQYNATKVESNINSIEQNTTPTTKADDALSSLSRNSENISFIKEKSPISKFIDKLFSLLLYALIMISLLIIISTFLILPKYVSSKINKLNATNNEKVRLKKNFNSMFFNLARNPYNIVRIIKLMSYLRNCNKYKTCDRGELRVAKKLSNLPKNKYKVLNNVLLKTNTEVGSTQIDHIVVSSYGVFVLETKNLSNSFIFQNEKGCWIQRKDNGMEENIGNPIKQNSTHIAELEKILDIRDLPYHSIIVLANNSYINKIQSDDVEVVTLETLIETFQKFDKVVLSGETIENIYLKLVKLNITNPILRMEHIININRIYHKSNSTTDNYVNGTIQDEFEDYELT